MTELSLILPPEIRKGLDVPVMVLIVVLSRWVIDRFSIKHENMPLVPVALGMLWAFWIEYATPTFDLYMFVRRTATFAGGAALAYQIWNRKLGKRGDDTLGVLRKIVTGK